MEQTTTYILSGGYALSPVTNCLVKDGTKKAQAERHTFNSLRIPGNIIKEIYDQISKIVKGMMCQYTESYVKYGVALDIDGKIHFRDISKENTDTLTQIVFKNDKEIFPVDSDILNVNIAYADYDNDIDKAYIIYKKKDPNKPAYVFYLVVEKDTVYSGDNLISSEYVDIDRTGLIKIDGCIYITKF